MSRGLTRLTVDKKNRYVEKTSLRHKRAKSELGLFRRNLIYLEQVLLLHVGKMWREDAINGYFFKAAFLLSFYD